MGIFLTKNCVRNNLFINIVLLSIDVPAHLSNTDRQCLPRAIALAKLHADLENEENTALKKNLKNQIRQMTRTDRNQDHGLVAAKLILEAAGIPFDASGYNTRHVQAIADSLPEYQILLYARLTGSRLYTLYHPPYNNTAVKQIRIAYHDNHFDYYVPTRKSINKTLCPHCNRLYTRRLQHRCPSICTKCHSRYMRNENKMKIFFL